MLEQLNRFNETMEVFKIRYIGKESLHETNYFYEGNIYTAKFNSDGEIRTNDAITTNGFNHVIAENMNDLEWFEENFEIVQDDEGKRLTLDEWSIIFSNMQDLSHDDIEEFGEWFEILWSDSDDKWMICYGYEWFEDGFKTESEAFQRLQTLEKLILK